MGGKVGVVAVEVLAGIELKAPHGLVQQALRCAYRVGHRHQHDLALDLAGRVQPLQQRAQVVGGQHAGQFFSVQTGLDVNLQTRAGLAKVKAAQRLVRAQAGR